MSQPRSIVPCVSDRSVMVPNVGAGDKSEEAAQECINTEAAAAETTEPSGVSPAPTQEHVLNCQFGQWHPVFKHCTPRSVVLELPEDVVRYLQQDGVVLPKGFLMSCGEGVRDDSDDEVDWGDEDEDEQDRVRESSRNMFFSENGVGSSVSTMVSARN